MPRNSATIIIFAMAFGFALASGCAGPNAQVSQVQSEKQELLVAVKTKNEEYEALRKKAASLEQRLDQSEKEIARLTGHKSTWDEGTRSASTKNLPLPLGEGRGEGLKTASPKQDDKAAPAAKLPWRAPAAVPSKSKPSTTPPKEPENTGNATKASFQGTPTLRSLAQRDSRLQYDAATDTARYQADISFEENGAGLTAEARKRLDDLATWLQAEQTKDLHVLVSGQFTIAKTVKTASDQQLAAARADSVADYLVRHGIAKDRLAVVGTGNSLKSLEATSGSPVQIRLAQSSAPILGLVPKQAALRR